MRWSRLPESAAPTWQALAEGLDEVAPAFDPATADGLPAPARRWLTHAIPAGAPLRTTIELAMRGRIRLGPRWLPFTATQILRAGVGFVWEPVVGGPLVRFVGADILGPDDARMEFRWQGVVPAARASGADAARSAAGRLAAETVAWLPQAATPQRGARWSAVGEPGVLAASGDRGGAGPAGAGVVEAAGAGEVEAATVTGSGGSPPSRCSAGTRPPTPPSTSPWVATSPPKPSPPTGFGSPEPAWSAGVTAAPGGRMVSSSSSSSPTLRLRAAPDRGPARSLGRW